MQPNPHLTLVCYYYCPHLHYLINLDHYPRLHHNIINTIILHHRHQFVSGIICIASNRRRLDVKCLMNMRKWHCCVCDAICCCTACNIAVCTFVRLHAVACDCLRMYYIVQMLLDATDWYCADDERITYFTHSLISRFVCSLVDAQFNIRVDA